MKVLCEPNKKGFFFKILITKKDFRIDWLNEDPKNRPSCQVQRVLFFVEKKCLIETQVCEGYCEHWDRRTLEQRIRKVWASSWNKPTCFSFFFGSSLQRNDWWPLKLSQRLFLTCKGLCSEERRRFKSCPSWGKIWRFF